MGTSSSKPKAKPAVDPEVTATPATKHTASPIQQEVRVQPPKEVHLFNKQKEGITVEQADKWHAAADIFTDITSKALQGLSPSRDNSPLANMPGRAKRRASDPKLNSYVVLDHGSGAVEVRAAASNASHALTLRTSARPSLSCRLSFLASPNAPLLLFTTLIIISGLNSHSLILFLFARALMRRCLAAAPAASSCPEARAAAAAASKTQRLPKGAASPAASPALLLTPLRRSHAMARAARRRGSRPSPRRSRGGRRTSSRCLVSCRRKGEAMCSVE